MSELIFQKLSESDFVSLYPSIIESLKADEQDSVSDEDLNKFELSKYPMEKVMFEVKNESSAFYLVKSVDITIGFLLMNCKGLESTVKENNVLEIELLYILPIYRKMGFGQQFFQKALELSKQCDAKHLWVSVRESNAKAINFYNHLGMRKFATRLKEFQGEKYNDLLLKIKTNRNN